MLHNVLLNVLHNVAGQLTLDSMYVFYRKPRTLVATILCKDLETAAAAPSSTDHLTGMVMVMVQLQAALLTILRGQSWKMSQIYPC